MKVHVVQSRKIYHPADHEFFPEEVQLVNTSSLVHNTPVLLHVYMSVKVIEVS